MLRALYLFWMPYKHVRQNFYCSFFHELKKETFGASFYRMKEINKSDSEHQLWVKVSIGNNNNNNKNNK